jgi:hypothetical protein
MSRLAWALLIAAGAFVVGGAAALALKNAAALALVLLGALLSLPGVPGQGVLTILIGLVLLDFPAKRRMERAILRRRPVARWVNRLRIRFGRHRVARGHHPQERETRAAGLREGGGIGEDGARPVGAVEPCQRAQPRKAAGAPTPWPGILRAR